MTVDAVAAAVLVFAALHASVSSRWLVLLGDTSYALYLFHTDTIGVVRKVLLMPLGVAEWPEPLATLAGTAICVLSSVLVALAVHRFIERPALKRLRALRTPSCSAMA